MAQELPFSSIPPSAELYSAGTSISRMIQGLGFRYYWATDGLRDEDLSYRPTSEAKNTMETIQHIYGLSKTILNTVKNIPSLRPALKPPATLEDLRETTLNHLKEAAALFENINETQLEYLNIIFQEIYKILFLLVPVLVSVAMIVWLDRRVWGLVQKRKGPNVVGPFGLLQTLADALKYIYLF